MINSNCLNVVEIDLFFSRVPKSFFWVLRNFFAFEAKFQENTPKNLTELSGVKELDKNHANHILLEQMHLF